MPHKKKLKFVFKYIKSFYSLANRIWKSWKQGMDKFGGKKLK